MPHGVLEAFDTSEKQQWEVPPPVAQKLFTGARWARTLVQKEAPLLALVGFFSKNKIPKCSVIFSHSPGRGDECVRPRPAQWGCCQTVERLEGVIATFVWCRPAQPACCLNCCHWLSPTSAAEAAVATPSNKQGVFFPFIETLREPAAFTVVV